MKPSAVHLIKSPIRGRFFINRYLVVIALLALAAIAQSNTEQKADVFLKNMDTHSANITVTEAEEHLAQLLVQAKQSGDTRYSGKALGYFYRMPSQAQKALKVRYLLAQHLMFSHQFDRAISMLEALPTELRNTPDVQLKLVNVHMLLGNVHQAEQHCQLLKRSHEWLLATICSLWTRGLQGENSKAIAQLNRIAWQMQNDPVITYWANDILLDLYLHSDVPEKAEQQLTILQTAEYPDPAPVLQLIDYYLLRKNNLAAQKLLREYQLQDRFWLRTAIAHKRTPDELTEIQQKQLQIMSIQQDLADLFILSLWSAWQEKDVDKALALALKNRQWSKKRRDDVLLTTMRQLKGGQV